MMPTPLANPPALPLTMDHGPQRGKSARNLRRILVLAGAALLMLMLTACGAQIDTVLTVEKDGSGVRTITATAENDDIKEYVKGGTKAVEKAIKDNIPAELEYTGKSKGSDATTVFTFELAFTDAEDYRNKVIAVLGKGGPVKEGTKIDLLVADSVFKQGVSVEENFTSQDLLAWLTSALVKSGTVPDDQKSNLTETGETSVEVDGIKHETSSPIRYSTIEAYGVSALTVRTEGVAGGALSRTLSFDLSREAYAHDAAGFDKYFADITPENGTMTKPDASGTIWTVTFPADSPEQLNERTDKALGTKAANFAVTEEKDPNDPLKVITTVVDTIDCSGVCAEGVQATKEYVLPPGWTETSGQASPAEGDDTVMTVSSDALELQFSHGVPFASVSADIVAPEKGEATATFTYVMAKEFAEPIDAELQKTLAPKGGSVETAQNDDAFTYTVTLTGDSVGVLDAALAEYLPGSSLVVTRLDSNPFVDRYRADVALEMPVDWLSGGVTDGVTYTVEVPGTMKVTDRSELPKGTKIDGGTATLTTTGLEPVAMAVDASGVSIAALVWSGIVLLLIIAAVLGVMFLLKRRKAEASGSLPTYAAPAAQQGVPTQEYGSAPTQEYAQHGSAPTQEYGTDALPPRPDAPPTKEID